MINHKTLAQWLVSFLFLRKKKKSQWDCILGEKMLKHRTRSDKHSGDLPATLEKERKEDEAEPDAR